MVSFKSAALAVFGMVAAVNAQDWGNITGQVSSIDYLIGNDYSLTSTLVLTLNSSYSLVDLQGRREGQIVNKTVIFNTVDSKYYAIVSYTNTAINQTETEICFPPVPIRVTLKSNNNQPNRIVDGNFFIGCVEKAGVGNIPKSSTASGVTIITTSSLHSSTSGPKTSSAETTEAPSSSIPPSPTASTSILPSTTAMPSPSPTAEPSTTFMSISTLMPAPLPSSTKEETSATHVESTMTTMMTTHSMPSGTVCSSSMPSSSTFLPISILPYPLGNNTNPPPDLSNGAVSTNSRAYTALSLGACVFAYALFA